MPSLLLWLITIAFFAVGLVGIIIPALPGIGIIYAGVLLYAIVTDFAAISVTTVVVMGALAALAIVADYAGGAIGARAGGGGKLSLLGAVIGAIVGVFVAGPVGLLIGSFTGTLLGALWEGQSAEVAGRVALMSTLGVVGATVVQFILGIVIIVSFLVAVLL